MFGTGDAQIDRFIKGDRKTKKLKPGKTLDYRYTNNGGRQNLKLWFGLEIQVSHHYAKITVPGYYHGKLLGLCGNNNQEIEDDFIKKDGTQLKFIANEQADLIGSHGYKQSRIEQEVANSWILGII